MKRAIITICLAAAILSGCSSRTKSAQDASAVPPSAAASPERTVTDSTGQTITLPETPEHVFALIGSIGEIWLLAGGELSGVTNDSLIGRDLGLPEEILVLGTLHDPNLELIVSNEPELVILSQDMASHHEIAQTLKQIGIPYYMAQVETLDDYLKVLNDFTTLTGDAGAYEKNGTAVAAEVRELLAHLPPQDEEAAPTALFLRAYSSGVKAKASEHTVCTILDDIGVTNIAAEEPSLLEDVSMEHIIEKDPDYIFVVTMGSSETDAIAALESSLMANPAWKDLTAVREDHLVFLPKDLYHYKPNNCWGEAYENLLKIVYPDIY